MSLERFLGRVFPILLVVALVTVLCVMASGCGGGSSPTVYEKYGQGVEGAKRFVEDATEVLDAVPEQYRVMKATNENLVEWELEILPYYDYEGLVNVVKVPDIVEHQPELAGMQHFHILGWAACSAFLDKYHQPHTVHFNNRMFNPVSAWNGDSERYLPTVIHELIHIQGVCDHGWVDENADQDVTMEVGAALVNGGNRAAFYPMIAEYRDIAMAYVFYEALLAQASGDEDALPDFFEWRRSIITDPFERQRLEKSWRHWNLTPALQVTYRGILHDYNWTVWQNLQTAMKTGYTPEIYLPYYSENPGALSDLLEEKNYDGTRRFKMDDFLSLIRNMKALGDDLSTTVPH